MKDRPLWKPILIVLIVLGCAWALSQKGLKEGMDLAGGFVLVYDVKVPEDQDAASAIDQIIKVLSKRVDPNGVRNLVWRRQGANRLEIQAALAPPEVRQLRDTYIQRLEALRETNITQSELEAAMRLPDAERAEALKRLAGDVPGRLEELKKLAVAFEKREAAQAEWEQVYEEWRNAQQLADRTANDPTAPESTKQQTKQAAQELAKLRTKVTATLVETKNDYEPALQDVLATNVDISALESALSLPDETTTDNLGVERNPRTDALKRIKNQHPARADQIEAVAEAWDEYAALKGPLDDPEDLIALLRGSGVLEFRIAPEPTVAGIADYHQQLREKGPAGGSDEDFRWFEIDDITVFADTEAEQVALRSEPQGYFAARGMVGDKYGEKIYLLLSNKPGERLSTEEPDWKLTFAGRGVDDRGFPAVDFRLNSVGAQYLGNMTENNIDRGMAIVLDGRAMSVATINGRIAGSGQISKGAGGYSQQELDFLVRTLNAGSLKAQLSDRPISVKFFNPQMGQDNLTAGKRAAIFAVIAVAIFMAIYYLFAGLVANFALAANIVIILGIMSMLEATFTLPGIAGIVLTIGMTVDANVLIFERIREELDRGAEAKTAIRLGYEKALSTIVDANITTLITCIVLGYFATVEVKGFAVTLGIGICASMFTALFCTRVVFNYYAAWMNPDTIRMLPNLLPKLNKLLNPTIDWVGKRKIVGTFSVIAMILSLAIVSIRGTEMLDIEFRSGTQVQFKLKEGASLTLQEARERVDQEAEKLSQQAGDDKAYNWLRSTSASIVAVGDQQSEFSIAVLNEDNKQVSEALKEAFSDVLDEKRPIHFKNSDLHSATAEAGPDVVEGPQARDVPANVFPITKARLGEHDRLDIVSDVDVAEYLGGVGVLLEDMEPAGTVADLTARVNAMRRQPAYEGLTSRQFRVIGIESAGTTEAGQPLYSTAVVVSKDDTTNYLDDPDQFRSATGLAATEWRLVRDALLYDQAFDSVQNFSSQVSGTMQRQAITAMFLSLLAVVIYIWLRFGSLRYGVAAIAALVHDVVIALGLIAVAHYVYVAIGGFLGLSDFKIDLAMVAALLTIVGYSLNDTIVVFDRIRENRGRLAEATPAIINDSINQTISRTMLTSGTTLLAVLTLYAFGGAGVHGFAFCMLIGILVGTYSSIGVAANLLLVGRRGETQPAPAGRPATA